LNNIMRSTFPSTWSLQKVYPHWVLWVDHRCNVLNLKRLGGGDPTWCAMLKKRCYRPYEIMGWMGMQRIMPLNPSLCMISSEHKEDQNSFSRRCWKNMLVQSLWHVLLKVICSFIKRLIKRGDARLC
jgi:hypothetical protein